MQDIAQIFIFLEKISLLRYLQFSDFAQISNEGKVFT